LTRILSGANSNDIVLEKANIAAFALLQSGRIDAHAVAPLLIRGVDRMSKPSLTRVVHENIRDLNAASSRLACPPRASFAKPSMPPKTASR
jgi:hypothetical protein